MRLHIGARRLSWLLLIPRYRWRTARSSDGNLHYIYTQSMTHEYILTRDILRSNPPTRPRKPIESHQTLSQVGGVWERDYPTASRGLAGVQAWIRASDVPPGHSIPQIMNSTKVQNPRRKKQVALLAEPKTPPGVEHVYIIL